MTRPIKFKFKAWAVVDIRKSASSPIPDAVVEMYEGCGDPSTNAIGIYRTKQEARTASSDWYGGSKYKVVPVEINYSLPTKK